MQLGSVFTLFSLWVALHSQAGALPPGPAGDAEPPPVAIIELFTSEGCSSCPPADALLEEVHLKQAPSGQLIVGISEHVTYWNGQGWKDPYSAPVFTDRQSVYAARLSPEGPYTPQMVANGREQFVGSDRGALVRALSADTPRSRFALRLISSTLSANGVDLKFAFTGRPAKPLDLVAVLTDDADRSNVLRGENSGRLLQHVSVARSLEKIETVTGDVEKTAHLPLPSGVRFLPGSGHHIVLFVQEAHQGAIVGAATAGL
jgi:hypothetical protein